jgi:WD repeat-containing protein 21A
MHSDENYLLASAMNGVIQQWDRRMVENGAVRTYEGHSNTHTSLQMGVDPSETFLVSGGEDRAVRIWSLTSGRLLHTQTGFSSPTTSVCWPASLRKFPLCTIIKEVNQLLDSCHLALTTIFSTFYVMGFKI